MSAFVLKVIATACMLIDHIGALFPSPETAWMRWVGRVAFPIYAYMIAQGCLYTRDIYKYLWRLGLFVLIAEVPYDLAFHSGIAIGKFQPQIDFLSGTNVFYTLFLGAACIAVFRELQKKKNPWLALLALPILPSAVLVGRDVYDVATVLVYTAAALLFARLLPDAREGEAGAWPRKLTALVAALPLALAAGELDSDYGMAGVLFIFAIYLVSGGPQNKLLRSAAVAGGMIYFYGLGVLDPNGQISMFYLPLFVFSLIAVLLVYFYNGKKGPGVKWAFYAFYPVHLAVLTGVWLLLTRLSY